MSHRLREASLHVVEGHSVVAPLIIDGLPVEIEALGIHWRRKREFHLTVVSRALLEAAGGGRPDLWEIATGVLSGRRVGAMETTDEVRRVARPDERADGLQTLIVMVDAPGLTPIYRDLSTALGTELVPPPAHVTLYSTDPSAGIGIDTAAQLAERAPPLSEEQQQDLRLAMSFGAVLASDEGIPARPAVEIAETLGETQPPFTANALAALAYAAHVHREQSRRRGAAPYISHLVAVAALVAEDGGGETELIGALLHDAAEDHGGERRLRDIELRFGAGVAQIVRALSDSLEPDGSPREPWRERKQRYVDALRDETDAGILRVSNADKLDNARGRLAEYRLLGAEMWDRRLRSRDEQLWYYRELAAIFSARRPESILASEFAATIAELERT